MEDYTNVKTFWKWYFSSKQNWLFGFFFNGMAIFGVYLMHTDPPDSNWFYLFIIIPIAALWIFTVRDYKKLKKGVSK